MDKLRCIVKYVGNKDGKVDNIRTKNNSLFSGYAGEADDYDKPKKVLNYNPYSPGLDTESDEKKAKRNDLSIFLKNN